MDCLTAALAIAEANENAGEIAHTVNVMAISYWQRGLLDQAEPLYHEAGRMARVAGDERLIAMVEQNLGVVASMHGDVVTALRHHTASLDRYRALGLQEELARQLSNIGLAHTKLGNFGEADAAYAEALRITVSCGDTWTRLMVEVNNVALLIAKKDLTKARTACDRILLEAEALHETRLLAETYNYFCGVIARETGRLEDAERFLKMAYDHAVAREDLLLGAEIAREQAELFLALGRNRDTLQRSAFRTASLRGCTRGAIWPTCRTGSGAWRTASTTWYTSGRVGAEHRVEGRVYAGPLRARCPRRVRDCHRPRLRRNDALLVPRRSATITSGGTDTVIPTASPERTSRSPLASSALPTYMTPLPASGPIDARSRCATRCSSCWRMSGGSSIPIS